MYDMQFDPGLCAACDTNDCFLKCQHMDMDQDTAREEILKLCSGYCIFPTDWSDITNCPPYARFRLESYSAGALCCGGGAGNFFTDILGGGEDSPSRIRAREAHSTGATVLAVACPNCLTMLEDAVKVEGLENRIKVRDISEIVSA